MTALLPVIAIISFVLTVFIRKAALKNNRLDIPNERSSHTSPTPRGSGLAVVVAFEFGLVALLTNGTISKCIFLALAAPGMVVAIIGRLDDLGHLTSAKWRLFGHFVCASLVVWLVGGLPSLPLVNETIDFGLIGDLAAVIYLVWMLNLFNFMDGIDLITGIQTLTTSAGAAALLALNTDSNLWIILGMLAAAVVGFMYFNLPPAKIFLGDVGSGFIGFTIGAISIVVAKDTPRIAWAIVILLATFVADSTTTLLRRLIGGDHVYIAHRSHAYQHLSKRLGGHLPVSLGVGAINVLFLFPIAWLVSESKLSPVTGLLVAYIPLVFVAMLLGAGKKTN